MYSRRWPSRQHHRRRSGPVYLPVRRQPVHQGSGKKLGQPLFIRSTKRVQLTPEGEILFKHIEPALNLIRKGENQLLEAHTLNGGQLRIGASDTICRYYLVPYLNQFHKDYPNIHIKL